MGLIDGVCSLFPVALFRRKAELSPTGISFLGNTELQALFLLLTCCLYSAEITSTPEHSVYSSHLFCSGHLLRMSSWQIIASGHQNNQALFLSEKGNQEGLCKYNGTILCLMLWF